MPHTHRPFLPNKEMGAASQCNSHRILRYGFLTLKKIKGHEVTKNANKMKTD